MSQDGIRADPAKIAAVKQYEAPTTVHELRKFLGFASYYR